MKNYLSSIIADVAYFTVDSGDKITLLKKEILPNDKIYMTSLPLVSIKVTRDNGKITDFRLVNMTTQTAKEEASSVMVEYSKFSSISSKLENIQSLVTEMIFADKINILYDLILILLDDAVQYDQNRPTNFYSKSVFFEMVSVLFETDDWLHGSDTISISALLNILNNLQKNGDYNVYFAISRKFINTTTLNDQTPSSIKSNIVQLFDEYKKEEELVYIINNLTLLYIKDNISNNFDKINDVVEFIVELNMICKKTEDVPKRILEILKTITEALTKDNACKFWYTSYWEEQAAFETSTNMSNPTYVEYLKKQATFDTYSNKSFTYISELTDANLLMPLYAYNDNSDPEYCQFVRINAALLLDPNDKLKIVENYFSEANLSNSIKNGDDPLKAGNGLSDNDKQALFLNRELMQKLPYYGDSPSKWLTSNLISEEQRKALCFYDKSETIPVETYTVGKLFGNQKMLLPFTIICKK